MRTPEPDLSLTRTGLRFRSPEAEKRFRAWREIQNLPIVRMVSFIGVPTWLASPWLGYLWRRDVDWLGILWMGYVVVVPVIVAVLAATYTRAQRFATTLGAFSLTVSGSFMLWIIAIKAPTVHGEETTGPAIAVNVLMACFALVLRLPPLTSALAIAPFMAAALALLVGRNMRGELSGVHAYAYVSVTIITYLFVTAISVVGERLFRSAFLSEQLLVRQKASLEESQDAIRRFVPAALAEHIISGKSDGLDAPERRRVTILFSDIIDFTVIADRVEPETLTQVIGDYMSAMTSIVDAHGGVVNEFMGDGLMALFGAPRPMAPEAQAMAAVSAGRAMLARLRDLNETWRKLGLGDPLHIRIGVNTGVVSVGSYGSAGRMTYTGIGLHTNIAARIQSHCAPDGMLIGEPTWQLVRDAVDCEPQGNIACKGVHFPVAIYAPRPERKFS